jgi:hypothetical protein
MYNTVLLKLSVLTLISLYQREEHNFHCWIIIIVESSANVCFLNKACCSRMVCHSEQIVLMTFHIWKEMKTSECYLRKFVLNDNILVAPMLFIWKKVFLADFCLYNWSHVIICVASNGRLYILFLIFTSIIFFLFNKTSTKQNIFAVSCMVTKFNYKRKKWDLNIS